MVVLPLLAVTLVAASGAAPVVVVDPGHGGTQIGAEGAGGLKEKDLALAIARRVRVHLEAAGTKVTLTRESDQDVHLSDRVARANRARPDLFVSIHANSMPTQHQRTRVRGIETFFLSANASGVDAASTANRENAEGPAPESAPGDDTLAFILADLARAEAHVDSSRLAYAVHQKLIAATRAEDHGVQQAPFYVLNGLDAPAILIEVGYISHPAEGKLLADPRYQDRLAQAIAAGVVEFLSRSGDRAQPAVRTSAASAAP